MTANSSILASDAFHAARRAAVAALLARRNTAGHWSGKLSSSALSTATAITALRLVDASAHAGRIEAGGRWLATTQLADGSWGDTVASKGNLSTTLLCWAALGPSADNAAAGPAADNAAAGPTLKRAEVWIRTITGSLEPAAIAAALAAIYGRDRTFSVPILTHLALCGRFGDPRRPETWRVIPQLPFELAALPQSWFRLVDMQVVSYALPALIAIGQVRVTAGGHLAEVGHHFEPASRLGQAREHGILHGGRHDLRVGTAAVEDAVGGGLGPVCPVCHGWVFPAAGYVPKSLNQYRLAKRYIQCCSGISRPGRSWLDRGVIVRSSCRAVPRCVVSRAPCRSAISRISRGFSSTTQPRLWAAAASRISLRKADPVTWS
ncbi:MAG: hypothetical protein ACKOHK_14845 [Planctomycetia bacterium]